MWAYFGKIWDTNVSIFWQKVDSNPNVSIIWQNPKKSILRGSMNFLTFCQNLLFGPKLDFWLKCDFVPLRVSQQRKEAGKNADFAIGGYSNNYSKKHREFRWSQRFFPLSIKYDFLEFLGCLFPPSAPLAKKNSEFLASRKPINPRGQVDLPRPT